MTPRPFGPPPQQGDVGDRVDRWRATVIIGLAAFGFETILFQVGALPSSIQPIVSLLTLPLVYFAGHAVARLAHHSAEGFFRALFSAGGEAHTHEYSEQEALVINGRIADAIASYHRHIATTPADLDARLRLAALLATHGNDVVAAEAMYIEVRVLGPSRRQDVTLSNGLIDLFRAQGAREQLKAELARFARRHAGSVEGNNARQYLRQLAQEELDAAP